MTTPEVEQDEVSVKEAAATLGIQTFRIWSWIRSGWIKAGRKQRETPVTGPSKIRVVSLAECRKLLGKTNAATPAPNQGSPIGD